MESMAIQNPTPVTVHGVTDVDLVFVIGEHKAWRLRADGAVLDQIGQVITRNVVDAAQAMNRSGWFSRDNRKGVFTGVIWGLVPDDGLKAAEAVRAA